jgi:glucosamine--fructose-6-phosphate aminotransferase (isomerizing)
MGMERIKAKFPNGVLRTQHPYYMAEAIRDVPGCLSACLAEPILEPARQALSHIHAETIFAVGCGTSYNACQAVANNCRTMLRIPAYAYDAYDFCIDQPPQVDSKSLVISISQSGGSLTSCLAQEAARDRGAMTVGITGNPESRLAKSADYALTDPFRIEFPLGKTRSYQSSAMLGMLAGVLVNEAPLLEAFLRLGSATAESIASSMDNLEQLGSQVAKEWARRTNHYLLTGFGAQKANADEIGLKIIEVVSESATAFGLEEFTHGPNASFRHDMGIFLMQTDARTLEKAVRIANGVAMSKAALLVITNHPEAAWPDTAWKIEVPELDDGQHFGFFTTAVAAQWVMYYLAIAKGFNPDINGHDQHPELGDIFEFFFPPGTH